MTKHRVLFWTVMAILITGMVLPAAAAPPPKEPAPKVGQKAGAITALLPVATISRGAGRNLVTTEAKKGDELIWNDLVQTKRGGRARITLADQSILSLGSQSELRIVRHDARTQQTALQLVGGRLRAEVTRIARTGGSFELRTPTAVAGVIGTDFGATGDMADTTFVCISGMVQVSNANPAVPGSVQCAPGMTTSVAMGKPPSPPKNATPEQIQQLILDTLPSIIDSMSPASALAGATVDALITGTNMSGLKTVEVSGSGVKANFVGQPTATSATVHLVLDAKAEPGPRTITMSKASGATSAAVFTILSLQAAAPGTDPKKPYLDLMSQEADTAKAGTNAMLLGVKQNADLALQALQEANQGNVDLTKATSDLNKEVNDLQSAINNAGAQIDAKAADAAASFNDQFGTAYQALLQRKPDGTPDDTYNQAVPGIFQQVNATLGKAIADILAGLNTNVQTANGNIAQLQQTWMATVTAAAGASMPTPNVNGTERSIDVGAAFGQEGIAALDAGNSRSTAGATIANYSWVLCDPTYRPTQFGVPVAATNTGCNPLPGYASSSAEFAFPTCNLPPADYIARLVVTDTSNKKAAMDVKVHVLGWQGVYDDPPTTLLNLKTAYETLQLTQFLNFFDQTNFSGYTALAENVRQTFPKLASMSITLRISQSNISCNDATLRADWLQSYTFAAFPNQPQAQDEQLSVRMSRVPGKGWFINDFQGDNGTLKQVGLIPGPSQTESAGAPDLVVQSVTPLGSAAAMRSASRGSTAQFSTNVSVPPGTQAFAAVIANIGAGDLTATTAIQFTLLDSSGNPLSTPTSVNVPVPLKSGATVTVTGQVVVPTLALGTPMQIRADANPGCTVQEMNCDAANISAAPLTLGTPLVLTQLSPVSLDAGGTAKPLTISVNQGGTFTLVLPAGITTTSPNPQTLTAAGNLTWNLSAALTATTGTNLTMNVTSGTFSFAATYSVNPAPKYEITSVVFQGHTAPYTGAQGLQMDEAVTLLVTVRNSGNSSPTGTITVTASCSGGPAGSTLCVGGQNPTGTINAPAAGASTTASMTFGFGGGGGNLPGTYTGTVTLTTTIPQSSTAGNTFSLTFEAVDFHVGLTNPTQLLSLVVGNTASVGISLTETGNPTPFNIPISASIVPANATLGVTVPNPNMAPGTTQNVSVSSTTSTPAGTYTLTVSGTNRGVTRSVTQALGYIIPTATQTTPPTLTIGGTAQPLTVSLNAPGTYTLVLPTGITTTSPNPQTLSSPGNLTWMLLVDATAATGGGTMNITSGGFTLQVSYSVAKPTLTQVTTPALIAGGSAQPLTVTMSTPGTYTLVLPTGITTPSTNPQTLSAAGNLTWDLRADLTATLGTALILDITGPGGVTLTAGYSVAAPTATQTVTPQLLPGGSVQPLTINASVPGTYTLVLPTGITTPSPNPQTITAAGPITWDLQASATATIGAGTTNVTLGQFSFPVAYTVLGPTVTQTVIPVLVPGGTTAQALTISVNVPGTYTLVLPTGITTTSANPQTISAAGSITWNLLAASGLTPANNLTTTVTFGSLSFTVQYSIGALANYAVTGVTVAGHTAPYTGAQGFQNGETLTITAQIANIGTVTQSGQLTVSISYPCPNTGGTTTCAQAPQQVSAPAAGQSVNAIFRVGSGYIGAGDFIISFTTTLTQSSTADDSLSTPFEGVDYSFVQNGAFTVQNQLVATGSQSVLKADVNEMGAANAFPIPVSVTVSPTNSTLSISAGSVSPGTGVTVATITASSSSPTGSYTVTVSADNHGVVKSFSQVINFMTLSIASTNIFLNDASHPLEIQVGPASSLVPTLNLQLGGTAFNGSVTLLPQPASGFTVSNISPASVLQNGTFTWQITASTPTATVVPVQLKAQIPNTNPITYFVYNVYVKAIGVPDLKVVSAVPNFTFSTTTPWIDGQPVLYTVTIGNASTAGSSSAGGETVTVTLNGYDVGTATVTGGLAPGATTTVDVHCVAPDVHGAANVNTSAALKVRVSADSVGDMNYTDNTLNTTVQVGNWHIAVSDVNGAIPGPGTTDTNPFPLTIALTIGPQPNTAYFAGTVDGGSPVSYLGVFSNTNGVAGQLSPKLSITNMQPGTSGAMFSATLIASDPLAQSGLYLAQVIAQLIDPITSAVTAQRQATLHVSLNNQTVSPASITPSLTSSAGNTTPSTPLQINGGLTEQYSVTLSLMCAVGPCPSTSSADLAFHDAPNTVTSPLSVHATSGTPQVMQVSANLDPNGVLPLSLVGPGTVTVGISGMQPSLKAGSVPPDPVGAQVPLYFNVSDLRMSIPQCVGFTNGTNTTSFTPSWSPDPGFTASLTWKIENSNHVPVSSSPITFSPFDSGATTYSCSGTSCSPALPAITLTNVAPADGLQSYFLAVSASNGISGGTVYFEFFVDGSTTQNFCGGAGSARGYGRTVQGSWRRNPGTAYAAPSAARRTRPAAGAGVADLRISPSDVDYSPSIPRVGDTLQVRFRVRNDGDADATAVPIALVVNGAIVASDTFDVPAGHTVLGGLTWASARNARMRGAGFARGRRVDEAVPEDPGMPGAAPIQAMLVIDPQHTTRQKSSLEKSAPLSHLAFREAPGDPASAGGLAATASQHLLLELAEGGCIGLRLATGGAGPCGSADVEISAEDVGKPLALNALDGIADLGANLGPATSAARTDAARLAAARFSMQAVAQAGHSYAVQLSNGRTAVFTIDSIRNPNQLDARARALFRRNAAYIMRKIAGDSDGPKGPGDVSGGDLAGNSLFLEISIQAP